MAAKYYNFAAQRLSGICEQINDCEAKAKINLAIVNYKL